MNYNPYRELKELDYDAYYQAVMTTQALTMNLSLKNPSISIHEQADIERSVVGLVLDVLRRERQK